MSESYADPEPETHHAGATHALVSVPHSSLPWSALAAAPVPADPPARPAAKAGIDVLAEEGFARLKGRKVGLVTNHTGRAADGTPTIDLLSKADGVKLVALFSPEHGIRGELDEKVGDTDDEKTGLPVYSLYGERRKPTAETLKGIDTLVYDIQDIGCRFYTYISTLGLVLEAAKEHGLKVVVLDRPNPIGGVAVEGPVRDAGPGVVRRLPRAAAAARADGRRAGHAVQRGARARGRPGRGPGDRLAARRHVRPDGPDVGEPVAEHAAPDGRPALPRHRPAGDDERQRRPRHRAAVRVDRRPVDRRAASWPRSWPGGTCPGCGSSR